MVALGRLEVFPLCDCEQGSRKSFREHHPGIIFAGGIIFEAYSPMFRVLWWLPNSSHGPSAIAKIHGGGFPAIECFGVTVFTARPSNGGDTEIALDLVAGKAARDRMGPLDGAGRFCVMVYFQTSVERAILITPYRNIIFTA